MASSEEPRFYKFPKTPHLAGSEVVDDDQVLDKKDLAAFASGCRQVVVNEKVDGANVGVHFDREWEPIMQKRGGILSAKEKDQYNVFRDWVYEHMDTLWTIVGREYVLFGEWLWARHSVSYNALPSYFIAFDLLEKTTGKFLSTPRFLAKVDNKVATVPILWQGEFNPKQDLCELLMHQIKQSKFGQERAEGVYVRFESVDYVLERAKLRRSTFVAGRESFGHSKETNTLANK